MTHTYSSAILSFAALFGGQAMAANDAPVTREQVKAELAEAIRTGNIVTGESGAKLNEQFPQLYPQQEAASSVTRAQVKAELAEAIRTGNMIVGESGLKLNKIYPGNYPAQQHNSTVTRAQVKAELAQAISNGLRNRYIEP